MIVNLVEEYRSRYLKIEIYKIYKASNNLSLNIKLVAFVKRYFIFLDNAESLFIRNIVLFYEFWKHALIFTILRS